MGLSRRINTPHHCATLELSFHNKISYVQFQDCFIQFYILQESWFGNIAIKVVRQSCLVWLCLKFVNKFCMLNYKLHCTNKDMNEDKRINQNELIFTLTLSVECLRVGQFTYRIQINCSSDSVWDAQRGCTIIKTY